MGAIEARRGAAVLVLAVSWGCSTEPGVAREAIRDGVADTTTTAVVGIQDDMTGATCTGALIAPNLVLTAQHCVAPIAGVPSCSGGGTFGPARAPGTFYVTTRPMFTFTPSDYHPVAEVVIPPGGDLVCGRDVALLVLTGDVASAEAAPIAPRFDPPPSAGELYSAVGFGGTGDFGEESGTRRRRDGLAVGCIGAACGADTADTEWVGE